MNEPITSDFPKGVPKNQPVGKSSEGVEIWNRDWQTVQARLFPDDINRLPKWSLVERQKEKEYWKKGRQYWIYPAGEKFYPEDTKPPGILQTDEALYGLNAMFPKGAMVLDLGCGGGAAAVELAKSHKDLKIEAIDYELGKNVPFPTDPPENVRFHQMDWRKLEFLDSTFDSIYSDQGVARYGSNPQVIKELTRVSKPGALLRASGNRGMRNEPNFYNLLAEQGWQVYLLRLPSGANVELTIAKLVGKK